MLIYIFDFVTLLRYDAELYNPIILKVYPLERCQVYFSLILSIIISLVYISDSQDCAGAKCCVMGSFQGHLKIVK
jgi:hypothetical protein